MRAVCLIGFAAMISIAHSSTTHADFPQLRSPSPISSLATISKTSTTSIHKQRRSASASAAKKSSAPHRATKLLVVGEQASELVQLVASTRRFAGSAAASGFFIQETLVTLPPLPLCLHCTAPIFLARILTRYIFRRILRSTDTAMLDPGSEWARGTLCCFAQWHPSDLRQRQLFRA
eukprot:2641323-Rhodomonas_salina.2